MQEREQELLEAVRTCTRMCIKNTGEEVTLLERSCFDRCSFKFAEAITFTSTVLRFQNLAIDKQQKQLDEQAKQPGFW